MQISPDNTNRSELELFHSGENYHAYRFMGAHKMNINGQDKRQLTRFNRRGSEHSFLVNGRRAYVGMTAWSPDGNRIAFVVYHDKALGGNADTLVSRVFVADLVESKVYNE